MSPAYKRFKQILNPVLRVTSAGVLTIIVAFLLGLWLLTVPKLEPRAVSVVEGKAVIFTAALRSEVVSLTGQWAYYPGIFVSGPEVRDQLPSAHRQWMSVPVGNISAAEGVASYRLRLRLDGGHEPLFLYIAEADPSIRVYCNGMFQPALRDPAELGGDRFLSSVVALTALNPHKEEQEIVISSNIDSGSSALYKRDVSLGTSSNVESLHYYRGVNASFILGLVVLMLANGFIFMSLMPGHSVISLITLFDTMLMVRILFGTNAAVLFIQNSFSLSPLSDTTCLSLQIAALMAGGMFGIKLGTKLFDPDRRVSIYWTWPIIAAYAVMGIVFSLNLPLFGAIGVPSIIVLYIPTLGVIAVQMYIFCKKKLGFYALFQLAKTVFIGTVVFLDLMTLQTPINFMYFVYAYIIFFACHIYVRLYDSNEAYTKVAQLNKGLEGAVRRRTQELAQANEELQRLSERYKQLSYQDPLTGLPNRRAFFENGHRAVAQCRRNGMSAFIIGLDVDHFKNINDTWGHNAGDAVLMDFAAILRRNTRLADVLGRCGGEEFAVVLTDITLEQATKKAETLRKACENHIFAVRSNADAPITTADNSDEGDDGCANVEVQVTTSLGVAAVPLREFPASLDEAELLNIAMKRADKALYRAKRTGRNKWCLYDVELDAD